MAPNRCTMCSEPGTKRCGTCLSSFYCSSACQTQDYPLHKLLCKELPTFLANNPRPANINVAHRSDRSDYSPKLGFLFPVNGNKPRLIWVKFKIYRLDNGKIEEVAPDLSEHLESQSSELRTYAEDRLDPVVDLYICKTSFLGGEPNQRLHRLLKGYQWTDGGNPIFDTKWAGNVVALHSVLPKSNKDPDGEGERDFEDVTLADLRHALIKLGDETILYESENENRFLPLDPKKWVRGVKISYDGDMMVWGKEKFRNVHVVREDFDPNAEMKAILQGSPEPEEKDISIISSHMGIPLLVSKCKLDHEVVAAFQAGKISLYGNNFDTQALMTNANPAATMNEWGYPGIKWAVGLQSTVLVVRKDGKPITAKQVEDLIQWIVVFRHTKMGKFSDGRDSSGEGLRHRREVVADLKLGEFEKFMEAYKLTRISKGDSTWADVVSPRITN